MIGSQLRLLESWDSPRPIRIPLVKVGSMLGTAYLIRPNNQMAQLVIL